MKSSALQAPVISKRPFTIVLILAVLLNIAGIGVKFFTDDPALYALIARNIARTNNFTDLIYHGRDWLDKPHFPFWMVALSFKAFGETTAAYKLPALIFFFISVGYTYKLAGKFYGPGTALIAVLILLTSQHTIMSNTDVRAEPYIMGLLMGSVYHFYKVKERFSWAHIVLASLMAACAVMTKGIYVLIPIGFAIMGDYLLKKDYKGLLQWKWLLAVALTGIFVSPEIYSLYQQFDLHPEKVIFGHTGISGIHWFLWDSQFGRFNNNSFIKSTHGNVLFFLHTLLWAFAPWAVVFFYALYKNIRHVSGRIAQPEYLCLCGAVPMLLIFSISKFQLPFYTNILFPFFAIITAVFISRLAEGNELKFFKITQYMLSGLLVLACVVLCLLFGFDNWLVLAILVITIAALIWFVYQNKGPAFQSVFLLSCCVAISVNLLVIMEIFPALALYKGDVAAAEYLNSHYPDKQVTTNILSDRLDFYFHGPLTETGPDETIAAAKAGGMLLIDEYLAARLKQQNIPYRVVKAFDDYHREALTLQFIIKSRRSEMLTHFYLIETGKYKQLCEAQRLRKIRYLRIDNFLKVVNYDKTH